MKSDDEVRTLSQWMAEYVTNREEYIALKQLADLYREKFPDWSQTKLTRAEFRDIQQNYIFDRTEMKKVRKSRKKTNRRKALWTIGKKAKIIEPVDAVQYRNLPKLKIGGTRWK